MLTHGGDIAGYFDQYGCEPLDFSANVSPLGLPEGVRRAVIDSLSTADQYPDPLCNTRSSVIGAFEGADPARILCGNGAADLIFRLVLAVKPKRPWYPLPPLLNMKPPWKAAAVPSPTRFEPGKTTSE